VSSESISLKHKTEFEFPIAISVNIVVTDSVLSVTNALCTDEKDRFLIKTIKAMVVTETQFEELSRNDFYTLISNNSKLLQEILSLRRTRHL
jgi:hypothetical protein